MKISADGGNGGDGYNGGIGGQGGAGGIAALIAGQVNEIATLTNVIENNPTIIIQKIEEITKEVDARTDLKPEQKSAIISTLKSIGNIFATMEPYARPIVARLFEAISISI